MTVEAVLTAHPELFNAMARLVPQLSSSADPPTAYELEGIVESPATTLFIARDGGQQIVGSLTLAVFHTPTGVRAWIEDVVVETTVRGGGIGSALVEAAVGVARKAGARTVDLTSRPEREDANRLYHRLGFERRETNVYRFDLRS
ncbi:MAG: GNAT family N-acetyltransferase [Acidimicrobiales bacterium]